MCLWIGVKSLLQQTFRSLSHFINCILNFCWLLICLSASEWMHWHFVWVEGEHFLSRLNLRIWCLFVRFRLLRAIQARRKFSNRLIRHKSIPHFMRRNTSIHRCKREVFLHVNQRIKFRRAIFVSVRWKISVLLQVWLELFEVLFIRYFAPGKTKLFAENIVLTIDLCNRLTTSGNIQTYWSQRISLLWHWLIFFL